MVKAIGQEVARDPKLPVVNLLQKVRMQNISPKQAIPPRFIGEMFLWKSMTTRFRALRTTKNCSWRSFLSNLTFQTVATYENAHFGPTENTPCVDTPHSFHTANIANSFETRKTNGQAQATAHALHWKLSTEQTQSTFVSFLIFVLICTQTTENSGDLENPLKIRLYPLVLL